MLIDDRHLLASCCLIVINYCFCWPITSQKHWDDNEPKMMAPPKLILKWLGLRLGMIIPGHKSTAMMAQGCPAELG